MIKTKQIRVPLALLGLLSVAPLGGVLAQSVTTTDTSEKSVTAPGYSSSTTTRVEETKPVPHVQTRAAPVRRGGGGGGTVEESAESEETTTTTTLPAPAAAQETTRTTETTRVR